MQSIDLTQAKWRFRKLGSRAAWLSATVPGCVHLDLWKAGRIPDPYHGTNELALRWIEECDWEYRTTFRVRAGLLSEGHVELCADGLDTIATVWLNGQRVAATDNMFVAHRWDVKPLLREGENVIEVRFASAARHVRTTRTDFTPPQEFNDPVGNCVRIRKQQCQFGWDWGPRFVTAGIWRGLKLEGWSDRRLVHVQVTQQHRRGGTVRLELRPELAGSDREVTVEAVLHFADREVQRVRADGGKPLVMVVTEPALWWPAGQGAQPLYDLEVVARGAHGEIGRWHRRIGLRTVVLDRSKDRTGERFRFLVNDRPVFLKGANWIPADAFAVRLQRSDYARDLKSAVEANMNCVRVWGGGIYEHESFYDLCDEFGLLVWQDFMFACCLYPGDAAFLRSVGEEAAQQVRRLHHRACLALWCGNNEVAQLNQDSLDTNRRFRVAYEAIFHRLLPAAVARHGAGTSYWPSSEWRADRHYRRSMEESQYSGDTHFWDVWHARHPVKDYEKWRFRFVSEFGMQSYSSPATNATFCPPGEGNVFGPVMENHQKNRAGNQIILDYVSRRYRFPQSQDDLIWLSQLNQAFCMKTGVEHYRRLMPHCMGALYWQLNDCWPVASWSSIEYTGRWKALQFFARRFFAPTLVVAHVPGDETATIGNYRATTVETVHLHTVHDAPTPVRGRLKWDLFHFDGRVLRRGSRAVTLQPGRAVRQLSLRFGTAMAKFGRDQIYLRAALSIGAETVSDQTVFLAPPRFLSLPRARTTIRCQAVSTTVHEVEVSSDAFQHALTLDVPGSDFRASDNWLDLYPREPKVVRLTFARPITAPQLRRRLRTRSLVDTGA
jgi:beta-mannosidase